MTAPTVPVIISTQPATRRFRNEGLRVMAKAKIAPMATKASEVAVFMVDTSLHQARTPGWRPYPLHVTQCRTVRSRTGRVVNPIAQESERLREQPGDVHLRNVQLVSDLGLRHVAVEAHEQNLLQSLWKIRPVRPHGLHI